MLGIYINIRNLEISRFLEIFSTIIRVEYFYLQLPSFVLFQCFWSVIKYFYLMSKLLVKLFYVF